MPRSKRSKPRRPKQPCSPGQRLLTPKRSQGAPAPTCVADSLEPNDSFGSPTNISVGTSLSSLTACSDKDVYRIVLSSPNSAEITFTWAPSDGALLVSWDGPIGGCASSPSPGELILDCTGIPILGDTFFFEVELGADPNPTVSPGITYSLDVQ